MILLVFRVMNNITEVLNIISHVTTCDVFRKDLHMHACMYWCSYEFCITKYKVCLVMCTVDT